jgi:hypothetical protein
MKCREEGKSERLKVRSQEFVDLSPKIIASILRHLSLGRGRER